MDHFATCAVCSLIDLFFLVVAISLGVAIRWPVTKFLDCQPPPESISHWWLEFRSPKMETKFNQSEFSPESEKTRAEKEFFRVSALAAAGFNLLSLVTNIVATAGLTIQQSFLARSEESAILKVVQRVRRSGSTSRSGYQNLKGERKITIMIKGIRVWMKEGMPASSQAVRLVRCPLFCLVGAVSAGLAFSAVGPTKLSAAETYAESGGGAISAERGDKPGNDLLPKMVQVSTRNQNREVYQLTPPPTSSIGVEIIGGLALFFWIQRFRNFSV